MGRGGWLAGELCISGQCEGILAVSPGPQWLPLAAHLLLLALRVCFGLGGAWGPWLAVFGIPFRAGASFEALVGELLSYDHV